MNSRCAACASLAVVVWLVAATAAGFGEPGRSARLLQGARSPAASAVGFGAPRRSGPVAPGTRSPAGFATGATGRVGLQAAESGAAGKSHPELPDTKGETCLTCHDDVASKPVVHGPVAGGECTSCHAFSGTGDATVVALAAGKSDDTAPLCTTCHDEVGQAVKAAHPHGPAAGGDCTSCHDPHGAEQPRMLKASQIELCGTCHDEAAGQAQKKVPHKPATTGCSTCHDPHGSKNTTLLHDTLNGLCLDCHAVPPVPEGAKTTPTVPMGDTHTVSRDALPHSMQLDLDRNGRGHPLANHPTSAAADPLNKERPFTCLSCHAAHGSDTPRLIAFELKPGEGVCQKCHEM